MSTPFVKGPFSADIVRVYEGANKRGKKNTPRWVQYRISTNPEDHSGDRLLAQRVRDGHFLFIHKDQINESNKMSEPRQG